MTFLISFLNSTNVILLFRCQQQYMLVAKKAAKNKSISADDYPICAADGTFSTRLCKSFDLSVNCWCIDKHTGVMVEGSQFGVPKLNFIIDCDKCEFD